MIEINKLYQGDCLEIMPRIDDKSIDMILCDLPYGTTACSWDSVIPFEPLWRQYKRIIKDNGAIVLFGSQPFTSALVMSNIEMFKYCWYWDKISPTGHLNAKKRPMRKIEDICIFNLVNAPYYPQGLIYNPRKKTRKSNTPGSNCYGKHKDENIAEWQGYPTERIEIQNENGLHPTQKPVALFEYLIRTYTNEGETVLDNCAGSGTTAIACLNTKRNYILIEKEPKYCDIIEKRIKDYQPRLF